MQYLAQTFHYYRIQSCSSMSCKVIFGHVSLWYIQICCVSSRGSGTRVHKLPVGKHSEHVLRQSISALGIVPPAEKPSGRDSVLLGK